MTNWTLTRGVVAASLAVLGAGLMAPVVPAEGQAGLGPAELAAAVRGSGGSARQARGRWWSHSGVMPFALMTWTAAGLFRTGSIASPRPDASPPY